MITFKSTPLLFLEDSFTTLAEIGFNAVKKDKEQVLREIKSYASQGAKCTLAMDGGQIIGYIIYAPLSTFLSAEKFLALSETFKKERVKKIQTACHVHVLKSYWKTGVQLSLSREMAKEMLKEGTTHLFLAAYATDELATYSLSRPGSKILEGFVDENNRQIGLRDLSEFLVGTGGK